MITKDLIELIDFGAALGTGFDKSLEDNKLEIDDFQNFLPGLFLAPDAFSGLGNVAAEWREVKQNEAARLELTNRFREKFDLKDDITEYDVEEIFDGLVRSVTAIARIVARKKERTAVVVAVNEVEDKPEEAPVAEL